MNDYNDIIFLMELRYNIDKYLFLGYSPYGGNSSGPDLSNKKVENAMKKPYFKELRRKINEAIPRANEIMIKLGVKNIIYTEPPVIEQNLLEAVVDNKTRDRIKKETILDIIEKAIGILKKEEGMSPESDDLLPILRRGYLDKNIQNIIDDTIKNNVPISFVMIDIDNFKLFNDKYGHQTGDNVLKNVSGIINRIVGEKGKVIRYGGEEISIILPNYNIEEAKSLAERIRGNIEENKFSCGFCENMELTISAGVACAHCNIKSNELIQKADKALMNSKINGRNQINIFQDI